MTLRASAMTVIKFVLPGYPTTPRRGHRHDLLIVRGGAPLLGAPSALRYPRRDIGAHRELPQDGHDEPANAERQVLDRRDAMRGRSRAQSSAC